MAASMHSISGWFDEGVTLGHKWMFVVVDKFDYEDYPVYAKTDKQFWATKEDLAKTPMTGIMETYNLEENKAEQMALHRCHRQPEEVTGG